MIAPAVLSSGSWPQEGSLYEQGRRSRNHSLKTQSGPSSLEDQDDALMQAVETWLLQCYPSTSGESTATIYRKLLHSLRAHLQVQGLDLDSPTDQLTQPIQVWATQRGPNSKRQGNVAPSTYNQRIAAIGSFYSWASQCGIYAWTNPTEQLSRTVVPKYAESQALDVQQLCHRLNQIDRSTPRGQRDYALLQVALNTGRSARELASLTWGNISLQGEHVTLVLEGARSGKLIYDTLDERLSQTLLAYLRTIYGENLAILSKDLPLWVSFSDRTYYQPIGQQTIADICETHLGVSRIQRLRHTFALAMDQLGAPAELIQTRLGHTSRSTTDAYLLSLRSAHNPYAPTLATVFGLGVD